MTAFNGTSHVVVIYGNIDPEEPNEPRWARSVIGPFDTKEEAITEGQRAAYYGLEYDVLAATPPFDVVQQIAAERLANS